MNHHTKFIWSRDIRLGLASVPPASAFIRLSGKRQTSIHYSTLCEKCWKVLSTSFLFRNASTAFSPFCSAVVTDIPELTATPPLAQGLWSLARKGQGLMGNCASYGPLQTVSIKYNKRSFFTTSLSRHFKWATKQCWEKLSPKAGLQWSC